MPGNRRGPGALPELQHMERRCSPAPLPELRDRFGAVPDHTKRAIVATLLCSVVGLVSVYVPVLTNRSLAAGHYFEARRHSRLARARANAALWIVLAASLFFGAITLLAGIGNP